MDPSEPHWRTNSSFSPPLSRRWDYKFQSDGSSNRVHEAPTYASSLSSHSKGSRSWLNSEHYVNHHHSASDGALSYLGSPFENFQAPRWTSPVLRFDPGEFSTPGGGGRPESYFFSRFNERHFNVGNSFRSPSPLSESSKWASSSKQPILFPPRNFSGRRPFISKPVYPLVFRNPVSNAEASGTGETSTGGSTGGKISPDDDRSSPMWRERNFNPELKFHKTLAELQKADGSPDLSTSSRREGFRWSNSSNYYELGFDRDSIDILDHIGIESQRFHNSSTRYQKCGLCERLLWQKSPWSSNRIVRSTDMPISGVLPCHHVFHADCLEETTPKSQIHEPPCPLCLKPVNSERPVSFSEPLQVSFRSVRRSQGANILPLGAGSCSSMTSQHVGSDFKRNHSLPYPQRGSSSTRSNFKKRFPFKGKMGKDLFGTRLFKRTGSSSSSLIPDNQNQTETRITRESAR